MYHFEAWDVLYLERSEAWDNLHLGRFVLGRFVLGRFVAFPKKLRRF